MTWMFRGPIPIISFVAITAAFMVGFSWLAIEGEWGVILVGVGLALLGLPATGLLLVPAKITHFLFSKASGQELGMVHPFYMAVWTFVTLLLTFAAMGVWAFFVFTALSDLGKPENYVPVLLWSIPIATAIWDFLATKDIELTGNLQSTTSAYFHRFSCVVAALYLLTSFPNASYQVATTLYAVVMFVCLAFHLSNVYQNAKDAYLH